MTAQRTLGGMSTICLWFALAALLTYVAYTAVSRERSNIVKLSEIKADKLDPVEKKCPAYQELRRIDFLSPFLRHQLCRGTEAYKRSKNGFPICELKTPPPEKLLGIVRQKSEIIPMVNIRGAKTPIRGYNGEDLISDAIRKNKAWEPELARIILKIAQQIPRVTFLDIGSNIGVYTVQAAQLGLPTLALDANIRNLLRLHLTLQALSLKATLIWNFIGNNQQLQYLKFPKESNVGAGRKSLMNDGSEENWLNDTIPIMPIRSEKLSRLIKTKDVVMKMDIEKGEATFLESSGSLFNEFKIWAVQMEWQGSLSTEQDRMKILDFFTKRGYTAWKSPNVQRLVSSQWKTWGDMIDILWLHSDFQLKLLALKK
ncbi:hypothetical protein BOX15_Mlig011663g3 [Macrostomum lignano]|uniref:Methyltransferase FkbM domain-containing protein n=1 Tax=Macrostomum lignano TaxID=282301 RepID=A0A267DN39_9PLAT|nr:hypothetical protein BOX15_Mlig011663g3 [Macrostomum lignano]